MYHKGWGVNRKNTGAWFNCKNTEFYWSVNHKIICELSFGDVSKYAKFYSGNKNIQIHKYSPL